MVVVFKMRDMYPARDIPPFVMYCVNGKPRSSLLIESTDSMIYNYIYMSVTLLVPRRPLFRGDTQITTDAIFSPRRRPNTRGSSAKQKDFPYPVGRMASTSFPSTKYVMTSFCFSFKLAIPMVVQLEKIAASTASFE